MHGYDLIIELEKAMGKKPSASQIYPVLKKLSSSGHLSMKSQKQGKKHIKVYSMTPKGNQLFATISSRFDSIIEAALRNKVKVCAHCNCEILKGAVTKKIHKKKMDFCCISCASSYRP